jgi:hypothetical protein
MAIFGFSGFTRWNIAFFSFSGVAFLVAAAETNGKSLL